MARFRATIQGCQGEVSRLGTASSGISAKVNGWDVGVNVYAEVDDSDKDILLITLTSGSNNRHNSTPIGSVRIGRDGKPEFVNLYGN